MLLRNLLLILGALFILAGAALGVVWLRHGPVSPEAASREAAAPSSAGRIEVLSAAHAIASGTLLQPSDIAWKELAPNQLRPGNLVRGEISEAEFMGAVTIRDFADGESLTASELIKLGSRKFLSAVLKPNHRAVSIFVDAAQSSSGLVLPGNHVDVILTQSFEGATKTSKKQSVAETVLEDVRIIAVDQALGQQPKTGPVDAANLTPESRIPKTVTLELTAREAEILSVADKLGQLQISVRPLENAASAAAAEKRPAPAWSTDVSRALGEYMRLGQAEAAKKPEAVPAETIVAACKPGQRPPCGTGSTLESSVRWPPLTPYAAVNQPLAANKRSAHD